MAYEIFTEQEQNIERYSRMKNVSLVKVDKNGTHIFADCTCRRCGGAGILPEYGHVDGGVCFECGGSGVKERGTEIKIYTPEYGAKLNAQRAVREEQKRQKMIEESGEWNKEWMAKEGFNEGGITYIVLGNTYEIKEDLKAHGAKFNYLLGWHMPNAEGYDAVPVKLEQVTQYLYNGRLDYQRNGIEELVKKLKEAAEQELKAKNGEHISEYVGTVGERREFTCKLVGHFCYESSFGGYGYWTDNTMHIYKFKDENGDIVVWNTATYLDDDKPEYRFKATIKEHSEYKGEKQTVVSRPKFQ